MMNFSEFFHMGGYAFYIWPAYGVALCVLLVNILIPYGRQKKLMKQLMNKLDQRTTSEKQDAPYS